MVSALEAAGVKPVIDKVSDQTILQDFGVVSADSYADFQFQGPRSSV